MFRPAKLVGMLLLVLGLCIGGGCHPQPINSRGRTAVAIPANWVDLPGVPFRVERRGGGPVLINRTQDTFDYVEIGCIGERDGKAVVLGSVGAVQKYDGVFGPGHDAPGLIEMASTIRQNAERAGITRHLTAFPAGTRIGVLKVDFRGETKWTAQGLPWPNRSGPPAATAGPVLCFAKQ
jgi:hypothetical protein